MDMLGHEPVKMLKMVQEDCSHETNPNSKLPKLPHICLSQCPKGHEHLAYSVE